MNSDDFTGLLGSFEDVLPSAELPLGRGMRGAWLERVATVELVAVASGYEDVPFCRGILRRVDTATRNQMLTWGPWEARAWMASNRDLLPSRVRSALEGAGNPYQIEWSVEWQQRWDLTVRLLDDEVFTPWGPGRVLDPERLVRVQIVFMVGALVADATSEGLVPLFLAGQNRALTRQLPSDLRQSSPEPVELPDAPVLAIRDLGLQGVEPVLDALADFLDVQRMVAANA